MLVLQAVPAPGRDAYRLLRGRIKAATTWNWSNKSKTRLNKFVFSWANVPGSSGLMVVRGEVYAWDGSKATGSSLYESAPRTISFSDSAFHR